MSKILLPALAAILLPLAPQSAHAEFGSSRYEFTRKISIPEGRERLVGLLLDHEVLEKIEDQWRDLRIVESTGAVDTPFLVRKIPVSKIETRPTRLSNKVLSLSKEDNQIQITSALTGENKIAFGLTIETPLIDFEREVVVEGSNDGVTWSVPLAREPIFDYSQFADFRKTTVPLPKNNWRIFRVTINQAVEQSGTRFLEISRTSGQTETQIREAHKSILTRAFRIDQIVFHGEKEEVKMTGYETMDHPVPELEMIPGGEKGQTAVEWSSRRVPLTEIEIVTPARNFRRTVVLQGKARADSDWQSLKRQDIFHYELGSFKRANLTIPMPDTRMERYRITIENRGSESIPIEKIATRGWAYRAIWLGVPGKSYAAWFGFGIPGQTESREASALEAILNEGFQPDAASWDGDLESNPGFGGKARGSILDRKEFLWAVISLTVGILILVLFQTAKRIGDLPEEEG